MIDGGSLFNLLTSPAPPTPGEIAAGPFGLLWFAFLVIPLRYAACRAPRAALLAASLAWLLATLYAASVAQHAEAGPFGWHRFATFAGLLAGLGLAVAWIQLLAHIHRRCAPRHGRASRGVMIALVWIGLHALVLPLWIGVFDLWYPSRLAVLHNLGIAYLMLRLIAWGVALADNPGQPAGLLDTACWLSYPPAMRLGPVMLRESFVERLRAWKPRAPVEWGEVGRRFGLFVLGGVGIALTNVIVPQVSGARPDYFSAPGCYSTAELIGVFYGVPIRVYLLLWTYNELAAALGAWVGIRVDNNFDWLPRATSVRDFWRRWHTTLGAWLRTYMYIPLGGNRRHVWFNYVVVFGYCGLWHGPSWSFLAWGLMQAAALIVQREWDRLRQRCGWPEHRRLQWRAVAGWLLTMHFACATIVVFCDFQHCGSRFFAALLELAAHDVARPATPA